MKEDREDIRGHVAKLNMCSQQIKRIRHLGGLQEGFGEHRLDTMQVGCLSASVHALRLHYVVIGLV